MNLNLMSTICISKIIGISAALLSIIYAECTYHMGNQKQAALNHKHLYPTSQNITLNRYSPSCQVSTVPQRQTWPPRNLSPWWCRAGGRWSREGGWSKCENQICQHLPAPGQPRHGPMQTGYVIDVIKD